ncbi:hypothetical protein U1Q18_021467 [Sarracenia purpurea var. burkii]
MYWTMTGDSQTWGYLVDGVGFEEDLALGAQLFLEELIIDGFDVEGDANPHHERAWPCTDNPRVVHCYGRNSPCEANTVVSDGYRDVFGFRFRSVFLKVSIVSNP